MDRERRNEDDMEGNDWGSSRARSYGRAPDWSDEANNARGRQDYEWYQDRTGNDHGGSRNAGYGRAETWGGGYNEGGYDQEGGWGGPDAGRAQGYGGASRRYASNPDYPYSGQGAGYPYGQGRGGRGRERYEMSANRGASGDGEDRSSGYSGYSGADYGRTGRGSDAGAMRGPQSDSSGRPYEESYLSWREDQIRKLDEDYDTYRKENHNNFISYLEYCSA
jgi:hypothetical protein